MAQGMCEVLWVNNISANLQIKGPRSMQLLHDHNLIQHDKAKHIEID